MTPARNAALTTAESRPPSARRTSAVARPGGPQRRRRGAELEWSWPTSCRAASGGCHRFSFASLRIMPVVAELILIRHGQSASNVAFPEANRAGRVDSGLTGRDTDVELTELGVAQAEAAGHWLGRPAPEARRAGAAAGPPAEAPTGRRPPVALLPGPGDLANRRRAFRARPARPGHRRPAGRPP